jgi:hypothetical protein
MTGQATASPRRAAAQVAVAKCDRSCWDGAARRNSYKPLIYITKGSFPSPRNPHWDGMPRYFASRRANPEPQIDWLDSTKAADDRLAMHVARGRLT